jgi:hypothetical protein
MSDTVSFDELDRQHVELLPARTVLSMFSTQGPDGPIPGDAGAFITQVTGLGGMTSGSEGSSVDGGSGTENS